MSLAGNRTGRLGAGLLAALCTAAAQPRPAPPRLAGQCRWVHGRFWVANGSGVQRIWIIGTKRIVAIPDNYPSVPRIISRYEDTDALNREALAADFHICALEDSRLGRMQHVRVDAVKHGTVDGRSFPPR
ncbi:MAG TPA: hypothetical protein VIJ59_10650 [Caulobacteraceae bacterium]